MDCTECRSLIGAYLGEELPASERAAFEEHVAACAGCGRELAKMRRSRRDERGRAYWARLGGGLAVAAAVLLAGWIGYRTFGDGPRTTARLGTLGEAGASGGRGNEAVKPARGGVERISRLHAARAKERFRALLVSPDEATDSVTKALRTREIALRRELAEGDATAAGRKREVELADVLYRLAVRTGDSRDINRALLLWRPAYDRLAFALGDSAARARMNRLERLVLGETGDGRSADR